MPNKRVVGIIIAFALLSLLAAGFSCAPSVPKTTTPATSTAPAPAAKTAPQVFTWRFQNNYATMAPPLPSVSKAGGMGQVGVEWVQWTQAMSNGRLKIELAPPDSIVPAKDVFRAVSTGALDGSAMYYAGFHEGAMPEVAMETGLFADFQNQQEKWDYWYNRGAYDIMEQLYEKNNVVWFPWMCGAGSSYHILSVKPVKTLADLQGLTIRIPGLPGKVLQKFGAKPTVLSASESYMALKLGTIDAAAFGYNVLESDKLKEVVKYVNPLLDTASAGISVIVNKNKFNQLPDDLKLLIMENSKYKLLDLALRLNIYDEYILANSMKSYGIQVFSFSPEDKKKIFDSAKEEFPTYAAKSPTLKKLIDILLQEQKDLGR